MFRKVVAVTAERNMTLYIRDTYEKRTSRYIVTAGSLNGIQRITANFYLINLRSQVKDLANA